MLLKNGHTISPCHRFPQIFFLKKTGSTDRFSKISLFLFFSNRARLAGASLLGAMAVDGQWGLPCIDDFCVVLTEGLILFYRACGYYAVVCFRVMMMMRCVCGGGGVFWGC